MSKDNGANHSSYSRVQTPVRFDSLCREISHAGRKYLDALALAIEEAAPRPGCLVYVQAKKFVMQSDGLEPVIFSAIDVSTHLQVAQAYLAMTMAAAVDFFDFVVRSFPFGVSEIRTLTEVPFHNPARVHSHHDFTSTLARGGILHSIITNPSQDVLFSIVSKMSFDCVLEGSVAHESQGDLPRELARFLFFHNNFRSLPSLGGKTPLQKLRTFNEFAGIRFFDLRALSRRTNETNQHEGE
jgi:hypothetical protein